MRLAIFGASGRTGKHLVEQALTAGHEVNAFIRDPKAMPMMHERLRVERGDATDQAAVERAIRGVDAVISVMNTTASRKSAITKPLTRATQNIIADMRRFGVRRLIITTGGIAQPADGKDFRFTLFRNIGKWIMPAAYDDALCSARTVQESDIEWTILRIFPTNAPGVGRVGAGYVSKGMKMWISRADAAAFILDELRDVRYLRQAPVIYSQKE